MFSLRDSWMANWFWWCFNEPSFQGPRKPQTILLAEFKHDFFYSQSCGYSQSWAQLLLNSLTWPTLEAHRERMGKFCAHKYLVCWYFTRPILGIRHIARQYTRTLYTSLGLSVKVIHYNNPDPPINLALRLAAAGMEYASELRSAVASLGDGIQVRNPGFDPSETNLTALILVRLQL